jgi:UDP-sugar transporter A1/2/3
MASENNKPLDNQAILYMLLLALQFGLQPVLTRKFTPPTVNKSSVILTQEMVKFAMAYFMLTMSGGRKRALEGTFV